MTSIESLHGSTNLSESDRSLIKELRELLDSKAQAKFSKKTLSSVGGICQKLSDQHKRYEDFERLQTVMATLLKLDESEAEMLSQHTILLRGVFSVITGWMSIDPKDSLTALSYHTSHHMALVFILNLMNHKKHSHLLTATINGDHRAQNLFSQVMLLGGLFDQEIRYSTQELLMEVCVRFYHVYSKSKDSKKFDQLTKSLPKSLIQILKDPTRGPKHILQNMRPILSILNVSNSFVVSVPIEDMYYMMTWKTEMASKSKATKRGKWRSKSKATNKKQSLKKTIESMDEGEERTEDRKTLGEVEWLDINVESLGVTVSTESDFQSPGDVCLLSIEYDSIIGIHFEDTTPSEETSLMKGRCDDDKGPPMMQVVLNNISDILTSLVKEEEDLPPLTPTSLLSQDKLMRKDGGEPSRMPVLRLYFETLRAYIDAKGLIEKRVAQAEARAEERLRISLEQSISPEEVKEAQDVREAVGERLSKLSVASTKDSVQRDEAVHHAFNLEEQEDVEFSLAQRDALSAPIRPLSTQSQSKETKGDPRAAKEAEIQEQESWEVGYEDLDSLEFHLDSQDLTPALLLEDNSKEGDHSSEKRKKSSSESSRHPGRARTIEAHGPGQGPARASLGNRTVVPKKIRARSREGKFPVEVMKSESDVDKQMKSKSKVRGSAKSPSALDDNQENNKTIAEDKQKKKAPPPATSSRVLRSRKPKSADSATASENLEKSVHSVSSSPAAVTRGKKQVAAAIAQIAEEGDSESSVFTLAIASPPQRRKSFEKPKETRGKKQVKGHEAALAAIAAAREREQSLSPFQSSPTEAVPPPDAPAPKRRSIGNGSRRKKGVSLTASLSPRKRKSDNEKDSVQDESVAPLHSPHHAPKRKKVSTKELVATTTPPVDKSRPLKRQVHQSKEATTTSPTFAFSKGKRRGPKQKSEGSLLIMSQQPTPPSDEKDTSREVSGRSVYTMSEAEEVESARLRTLEQEKDDTFGAELSGAEHEEEQAQLSKMKKDSIISRPPRSKVHSPYTESQQVLSQSSVESFRDTVPGTALNLNEVGKHMSSVEVDEIIDSELLNDEETEDQYVKEVHVLHSRRQKKNYPQLPLQSTVPMQKQLGRGGMEVDELQEWVDEEEDTDVGQSDVLISTLMNELQQIRASREARKQQARSEKICSIALQQISCYVKDWGDYFFEMNKLPLLWETVVDKRAAEFTTQRSILGKIEEMSNDIAITHSQWNEEAQVRILENSFNASSSH